MHAIFPLLMLLLKYSCALHEGFHLITTEKGCIGAENTTHYQLDLRGPVLLVLETLHGDADLYVSYETKAPSYLNYDFSSTTCGTDSVEVGEIKRPLYIGIYGSHAFEVSEYVLYVYRPSKILSSKIEVKQGVKEEDEGPNLVWTIVEFVFRVLLEGLL